MNNANQIQFTCILNRVLNKKKLIYLKMQIYFTEQITILFYIYSISIATKWIIVILYYIFLFI